MYNLQDRLARDERTHGTMLVTVILGADKTTVSIATGHTEYHPVYLSLGNLDNSMRRGHRDLVIPIAFLAIPKCRFVISRAKQALLTLTASSQTTLE
jgi:hypothetical protein